MQRTGGPEPYVLGIVSIVVAVRDVKLIRMQLSHLVWFLRHAKEGSGGAI